MNFTLKKIVTRRFLGFLLIVLACILFIDWTSGLSSAKKDSESSEKQVKTRSDKPVTSSVEKSVLTSQLAGSWYPGKAEELREQLKKFFTKADVNSIENVIGLILPHAGYRYSGQTAAIGVKTINKKYKRVVILGPTHRAPIEQILSLPGVTHYKTPLGEIPLDVEFIDGLLQYPMFQELSYVHQYEHSVQIEIPLLQYRLKDFKLVPIVTGRCSKETIKKAAKVIRSLIDEDTLVVASSDFTHYGPRYRNVPFKDNIPESLKKLDMGAYEYIKKLDTDGFLDYKQNNPANICGYIPIAILLSMLDKRSEGPQAQLLQYTTSGEIMDDYKNSVSYLSVAFQGNWRKSPLIRPDKNSAKLSEQERQKLLKLARKSLTYTFKYKKVPRTEQLGIKISPAMKIPRAAFVTLNKDSHLRGCIGDIFPQRPLYKSVLINAINAAFRDKRFPALQQSELDDIHIEISALTRPQPVASPNQIRIGTDGIVLRKNGKSAVYLPHVATQQGWDLSETLNHLSQKASLPADAWKEGASFLVFQADIFGEEK